jgi:signal transduction histidine kinase
MLAISSGLTSASLWFVHRTVETQVQRQITQDLRNSVATFQNTQREREMMLSQSAGLLADLPNLKAIMTTHHAATIQDASEPLSHLGGGALFLLADRGGKVMALHTLTPGLSRTIAQQCLDSSLQENDESHWWYGGGHLYQVFIKPIYFGTPAEDHLLGVLAVGYEMDADVAREISRISGSQVVFRYGDAVVVSTLSPGQESELSEKLPNLSLSPNPGDLQLAQERYIMASFDLSSGSPPVGGLTVLKSYDQASAFLLVLNRLLISLGLIAVFIGSALVFLISRNFTRPLENLVAGVRALEKGDFAYPVPVDGGDEVSQVRRAFDRMRGSLKQTQNKLLEAERLATIGQMASSISHDLRHPLTAIMANAEFMCEGNLDGAQRDELYVEIRSAVNQMTDLIDSLLEFSRTRESLRPEFADLEDTVQRSVQDVSSHPQFRTVRIVVHCPQRVEGWIDPRRLERVFRNLIRNACEAVLPASGQVEVTIQRNTKYVEVRVSDDGPGVPESIRGQLFRPFVSYGKANGTGLGLTVVEKIVDDHGGSVVVESTSAHGTVFKVLLPARLFPTALEQGTAPVPRFAGSEEQE